MMLCYGFDIAFVRITLSMVFWGLEEETREQRKEKVNNIVVYQCNIRRE